MRFFISHETELFAGNIVEGNKMDASNLATLFAPNILHKSLKELSSNDLSEEMTMERRLAIDVVTALIVNYEYLFKVCIMKHNMFLHINYILL